MFQTFDSPASPEFGPARLKSLRELLQAQQLSGFIVPRADVFQGEYVAPCDARLEWLTGFTGSAGFAIALLDKAGVFIDGRYRTQVKAQVDLAHFTPVPWPETRAGLWLREHYGTQSAVIGFDPWLHSRDEIAAIETDLLGSQIRLQPCTNLIDQIWHDRPAPPMQPIVMHPDGIAGETSLSKRQRLAQTLVQSGQSCAILTQPDSICWLLNIRGSDVPRNPVPQVFAILFNDGHVQLFTALSDVPDALRASADIAPMADFAAGLVNLSGRVRVDANSAPLAISQILHENAIEIAYGEDPCRLPKACKNAAELAHMREAHLRDGAAVVEFLHWLDSNAPGNLTEIDVVTALEEARRATNQLRDISFDTICGAGPNGAIIHYRVTTPTNRPLRENELLLVDSGAQYQDGTTDITRTIAIGTPNQAERTAYTAVLRGMMAISMARWPAGLAGRDLDPLARQYLWQLGLDYDHGTGHGVGAYLCVHEGPQRISRVSEVTLQPGMILSNEPGYYLEGHFGIRLENLIVVELAPVLADPRKQLRFETLTFAPFDRSLIITEALSQNERDWLNSYHAEVFEKLAPRLSQASRDWLKEVCAPL